MARRCRGRVYRGKWETTWLHFFWTDPRLGGIPLSERFRRLYDLTENRSSLVVEMSALGWKVGGEAWVWRRQLWAWEEEMLSECRDLLHDFLL
jgi:hypothetical protein